MTNPSDDELEVFAEKKDPAMKDVLILLLPLVIWFVLNRWVLPAMGVQT